MAKRGKVIFKQKKSGKVSNNIDDFLKKEFDNIIRAPKSKPLIKASEVLPESLAKPPMKKMMKFSESADPPPFIKKKEKKVEKKPPPPGDPDDIYEEDFEDFEEVEVSKPEKRPGSKPSNGTPDYSLETLKKDLEKENAAALKREEEVSADTSIIQYAPNVPTFENIDAKLIAKQQKRNKDIIGFIRLEKESFSHFELLPLTDYDSLITKVNNGTLKNTATQAFDDNITQEVQCTEILTAEIATQWPGDLGAEPNPTSLHKFLNKVSPMMEILLEENLTDKPSKVNVKKAESETGEIISQTAIPGLDFLQPRFPGASFAIKDLVFFPVRKNLLCAVYNLENYGSLLIVWDVQNPGKPNRLLYSVNEVTSVCMSVSKEHIVIAGNSIGSLELWDLREAGAGHEIFKISEKKKLALRSPTYSTDSLEMYTHEGKILKILEIPGTKGENFAVVASDSEGNLVTWSIIEMMNSNIEGMDFGLRIGGRVKMVKSHRSSIREIFPKNKTSACSALALDFSDNQKFLFASPNSISYGNRFGTETFPSTFAKISSEVTSINFASENNFQYFLVGFSCGSVSLYDKNYSNALLNWIDNSSGIIKIGWDISGRCGFFTVDRGHFVNIWDLKRASYGPICKIKIDTSEWGAVDWVLPESSKHSLIIAVALETEIRILNLK